MLETLDHTIRIGSTPTFLYFDLYLYSAYAAHYVYYNFHQVVDGIIELAREKDQKQMEFLGLLEADDSEDEGIECSLGMYSTVHASFRTQPHVRGGQCSYIYLQIYCFSQQCIFNVLSF